MTLMCSTVKTIVLAGLLWSALVGSAQNQRPVLEAVSVKPARTNRFVPIAVNPQSFRTVMSLAYAIEWAYEIRDYQLSGGPAWLRREYYEIEMKTAGPATRKEMREALQTVLAERFKLKLHREPREMPIYALTIGNSRTSLAASKEPCGDDGCIDVAPGILSARNTNMSSIAATLSNMVDRPVIDQTGLNGRYDFRLKFDPTFQKRFDGQTIANNATDDPSIFAALQDLGLKLEPRRTAVEIVVVDAAEKAAAN
jgi:bla regulator protein blaR1